MLNVGTLAHRRVRIQDAIALAKGELIEAVAPGGTAILNADDPRVAAMAQPDGAEGA